MWRGTRLGVQIVAALLSLTVLVGSGWAWASYRSLTMRVTRVDAISGDKTKASQDNIDGQDQNILIAGNDDRTGYTASQLAELGTTADGGSENTDTLMLVHLPANGSKATVISFPRDSYVAIPGHGMAKINAAYVFGIGDANGNSAGGSRLLIETIENLTGLKIDHFVMVNLLGFYNISKAIDGVTVCLNQAVKEANSGIDLPKGKSTIEGTQALAFVRQRYGFPDGLGDLDRIKRQQYFLAAVFRKMSSFATITNPFKLQNLLKAIGSSLTLDTDFDLLQLAHQLQTLQAGNVTFTTIPTDGFADEQIDGTTQSTVVVHPDQVATFVEQMLGTDPATTVKKAKAAAPASVTVAVANDTSTSNGVETRNAAALRALGFKTQTPPATSEVLATTTIRYAPGMEDQAKALLDAVPQASLQRVAGAKLTLLLGNNGVQVSTLMPKTASGSPSTPLPTPEPTNATTTAADGGCIN